MRIELIGRGAEIALLDDALAAAVAGTPRVVLCGGEPGIGKSRLAEETAGRARARGVPVLWGRGPEDDGAPPYWTWRAVVRGAAGLDGASAAQTAPPVRRALAVISGEHADRPDGTPTDGETRFAVFDGVARLLREASEPAGLLVVLDDLHGADRPSQQVLVHVVRSLGPSRLLIIATFRDTEPGIETDVVELTREPATRRLALRGLTRDDVRDALTAAAGTPVGPAVCDRVHALTGGNPLFVTELTDLRPGAPLPTSLRAVVDARVGRTSAGCRGALRAGAVLGRAFPVRVLDGMLGDDISPDVLEEALAAGLVERDAPAGYRFVHALVRDAVEDALAPAERAALHRAAAEALASVHAGRLEPVRSDIARHRVAATATATTTDRLDAVAWTERAACAARARLADAEAARLLAVALEHGGADLDAAHRGRLLLERAVALQRAGDLPEARTVADDAAAHARLARRPDLLAEAALVVPCVVTLAWERAAGDRCREALSGADELPAPVRARLLARLAEAGMYTGALTEADDASREALDLATDDPTAVVAALRARALARSGPDGTDDRAALADRMLDVAERGGDPGVESAARSWRIDVLFARGDLDGVAAELEQLAWCAGDAGPVARWWLWLYRGTLAQARGEVATAREHVETASAVIAPVGHPAAFPIAMSLRLAIDRHQGADPDAEHVRACRSSGPGAAPTPGHAFRVMDLLGPATVLAQAGHLDEAAAKFRALGPAASWRLPPYHLLPMAVLGIETGIRIDAVAEVAGIAALLEPHRGRHAVSGKDVTYYCGPVEIALGRAAALAGDLDGAVRDLERGAGTARRCGATGFAVEADVALGAALDRRGSPGDRSRARDLLATARPAAQARGMAPVLRELDRVAAALGVGDPTGLTRRERQIASAVARGLTNRRIADELVLSERTVENHVQHVLTKLGATSRHQIAGRIRVPGLSTDPDDSPRHRP